MNFIHFIKEESSRSIEKLLNNNSKNDTKSYINHNKHTWIENLNSTNNNDQMIDKNVETVDFLDLNKVNNVIEKETILTSRIGFKNIGDTCYINAALQILIHNNDIIEELLNIMIYDNKELTKSLYDFL